MEENRLSVEIESLIPAEIKSDVKIFKWINLTQLLYSMGIFVVLWGLGKVYVYQSFTMVYSAWALFFSIYIISPSKENKGFPKWKTFYFLFKKRGVYLPVQKDYKRKKIL